MYMKSLAKPLMLACSMFATLSCGGTGKENAEPSSAETSSAADIQQGKTLIVFFSHAGENYSVGHIEVGNTKIVAEQIKDLTNADQFEIVCVKDYDMSYSALCDLAKKEQQDGELPDFKGKVDNIDQYSTIFIGGPVWWGTWPQLMFTFFSKYDLNGKTLIPFTTHEGSGLGNCVTDLKKAYPNAKVLQGFSIYGHDVRSASGKAKVEKWVKGLK